jgi:hypothetical protein
VLVVAALAACGPSSADTPAAAPEPTPIRPAAPGDRLVDVTAEAGLDFVHRLVDGEMSNIVESLGSGAAVLDADGDGWLDLYLVQSGWSEGVVEGDRPRELPANRLFRNRGDGRFEDVTARAGVGDEGFGLAAVAADYDGDGDEDLYVCNLGSNRLYRNQGDGRFEDVTASAGVDDPGLSVGATFFDADGDGRLDLYVTNYLEFDPQYAYFYAPDVFPPPLAYEAQPDTLYRNLGDGRFEDVSEAAGIRAVPQRGMSVLALDVDDDALADVFVANDASANQLWRNQGEGRFLDVAPGAGVAFGVNGEATAAMTADWGDCDGDGRLDLVVTDISYGSLYRGLRAGLFADEVMSSGLAALAGQYVSWGGGFVDSDNDADLDLLVVNGDLHHVVGWEDLLLDNDGSGRFTLADDAGAYFEQKLMGRGGLSFDYDNDGDRDLLITNLMDRPVLLRNDGGGGHHWLTVSLSQPGGNRAAWGARLTLQCGQHRRTVEARCPTSYLCSGDPRLHFGLGSCERIDRLEIRWPSGRVQVLEDLPADQHLVVERPEGEG